MFQALIVLIQMLFANGGNSDVSAQAIRSQLDGGNYHESSVTYDGSTNRVTVVTSGGNIIVIDPEENN